MGTPQITYEAGEKIRTFGGWYQHTKVFADGRYIGTIQTRRRNKRTESITLHPTQAACVLGSDVRWLLKVAQEAMQ